MDNMIRNFSDLCAFFYADEPRLLNHRIYKDTGCGASISIRLGNVTVENYKYCFRFLDDGSPYPRLNVIERNGSAVKFEEINEEIGRFMGLEKDLFGIVRSNTFEKLEELEKACREFKKKNRGNDVKVASVTMRKNGVLSVAVTQEYKRDETEWIHNGDHRWNEIGKNAPVTGFTIQTIVEEYDATVDSDLFEFPVDGSKIDEFIDYMEQVSGDLWEAANYDHYAVKRDGDWWAQLTHTWDGLKWELDPQDEDKEAQKALEKAMEDGLMREEHEFGYTPLSEGQIEIDGHLYELEKFYPEMGW